MDLVGTFLRLAAAADKLAGGPAEIRPLELDRDWPAIEALLRREEWPFVRADLEVGHAQPKAVGHVARVDGRFAGFFTTHAFGDVGYLDMMIVDAAFRGRTVARPLYLQTLRALQDQGVRGMVVHTTNDSARLIRLLGFQPGIDFTLWTRDPRGSGDPGAVDHTTDREAILTADAAAFGMRREAWIDALLAQPEVRFVRRGAAQAVLRPRAVQAVCIDAVSGTSEGVQALVDGIVAACGDRELQCFARTGGALEERLRHHGFTVPDFFVPIGPLTEWRQGDTSDLGATEQLHSLMWL